ncbi:sensor histidine kinase [Actinophytocola oryzae]|nr:sensor histidine kinase [Actinophytocola oryzae]
MPAKLSAAARWRAVSTLPWQRLAGVGALTAVLALGLHTVPGAWSRGTGTPLALTVIAVVVCAAVVLTRPSPGRAPVPLPVLSALFVVMLAGSTTLAWFAPTGPGFLTGLVTAGAATRFPQRLGRIAVAVTLLSLACAGFLGAHLPLATVAVNVLGAAAFYRVGLFAARLRARTDQAEHLLAELEQSRAAQLHAATLAERQRLAREMHDVLAHSLSGLLLHLEGAKLLAADESVDPRLRDTVDRAHHLANSGLREARQAIGTLRDEDLPGPERLPFLVDRFREDTGIPAELAVTGTPRRLTAQARLTLFRVAQEAMTNAAKHAAPSRIDVRLGYDPDGTRLTVRDYGGTAPADAGADDGYGITGMRERAELLGGTLSAGPTDSGFLVTLWLPT